jgi:hypothetical protein
MSVVAPQDKKARAQTQDELDFNSSLIFALLSFILPGFAVALTIAAIGWFNKDLLTTPQVQLPIVLIAAVLTLIGALTFMVIVLHWLRLTTKTPPWACVSRITPTLTLVSPVPAPALKKDKGTQLPDIRVNAVPPEQAITWRIVGDDDGTLLQTSPGVFTYTRGSNPADIVTLEFSLVGNPDVVARLEIHAA